MKRQLATRLAKLESMPFARDCLGCSHLRRDGAGELGYFSMMLEDDGSYWIMCKCCGRGYNAVMTETTSDLRYFVRDVRPDPGPWAREQS